ncbi:MAG TPA: hypothetical protein VF669_20645 [Tepidisphaeraceae bacterium]|jgi:hypothetical protein
MDFDPSQHASLLAALLLIPGLIFLFIVVIYVAFIGKSSPGAAVAAADKKNCLTCGRTLLPDQVECPTCQPAMIPPPLTPTESPAASDGEQIDDEPTYEIDEMDAETTAPAPPPIDTSTAYEGEIVDDNEPPRNPT